MDRYNIVLGKKPPPSFVDSKFQEAWGDKNNSLDNSPLCSRKVFAEVKDNWGAPIGGNMSSTEIYGLKKNTVEYIGETRNSWRGAMAIWIFLEKKYLPKYIPDWVRALNREDQEYSRTAALGRNSPIKEIFDLFQSPKLTKSERIVLGSTFDNVLAKVEDIDKVLQAFREFEGDTTLKEQANIIEQAIKKDPEIVAIGWNQTSVNSDTWASDSYDEEKDEYINATAAACNSADDLNDSINVPKKALETRFSFSSSESSKRLF